MKSHTLLSTYISIIFSLLYANSCITGMQKMHVPSIWAQTYATAFPKWKHIDAHITFDDKKQQVSIGLRADYKRDPLNKNVGHCSYADIPLRGSLKEFQEESDEQLLRFAYNTSRSQFSDVSYTMSVYHIDRRFGSRVLIDRCSNEKPTVGQALRGISACMDWKYKALYLSAAQPPLITRYDMYGISVILGSASLLSLYKYLRA
ncbi:MAG: hypothetical protein WCE21_00995 [Candidatus Babeliales bacterium]